MSIASNLQTLASNLSSILSAINTKLTAKGSTAADTLDDVAGKINAIPSGGVTPTGTKDITENGTYDVTSYASASVAVPEPSGTTTITENGTHNVAAYASATVNVPTENPPSGTIDITTNGVKDVSNYASANVNVPTGPAKSSSDITVFGATVTVPAGLYAAQANKSVATATHNKPTISVNLSTGKITASHTQAAGYVSADTKSDTQNLTTQGAQTFYPGIYDQSIQSGKLLTGNQTFKAVVVSGLSASVIKNGVTVKVGDTSDPGRIESVTGTYSGGGDNLSLSGSVQATRAGGGMMGVSNLSAPTGKSLVGVFVSKGSYTESPNRLQSMVLFTNGQGSFCDFAGNMLSSSGVGTLTKYGETDCAISLSIQYIGFDSGIYNVCGIYA